MDRVVLIGVVLAVGSCTSFVTTPGGDTGASSSDDGGLDTTPPENTTGSPFPTSGTGGGSAASEPTTDPTLSPTTGDPTTGSESSSGGGGPTGDDTTGRGPTDGSSSGDPPEDCGDGIPQRGEDCDDSNTNELDGCTSACGVSPTGIAYGAIVNSGIDGGGSTTGISDNTDECPPDQVLVGLRGELTSDPWIASIGGICRPAALTNTDPPEFATGAPATNLPERGGFGGGDAWSTECGADEVIVAVRGGAGDVIDGLQIRCATLDTVGEAGSYSLERTPAPGFEMLQGGMGGAAFGPLTCPSGTVAMGLRSRTNSFTIEVELRCRELDLTY